MMTNLGSKAGIFLKKMFQGCRFVPYTSSETKPQMVPMDLHIGFQGLALIQGQFRDKSTTLCLVARKESHIGLLWSWPLVFVPPGVIMGSIDQCYRKWWLLNIERGSVQKLKNQALRCRKEQPEFSNLEQVA